MRKVKISQTEWMKELDGLRNKSNSFTPEIDEVVLYARDGDPKVSYPKLIKFLRDRFNWQGSKTKLRERYVMLKNLPS